MILLIVLTTFCLGGRRDNNEFHDVKLSLQSKKNSCGTKNWLCLWHFLPCRKYSTQVKLKPFFLLATDELLFLKMWASNFTYFYWVIPIYSVGSLRARMAHLGNWLAQFTKNLPQGSRNRFHPTYPLEFELGLCFCLVRRESFSLNVVSR